MLSPPSEAGGVHDTVTWLLPSVTLTLVGTSGTVTGTTLFDAGDAALVPARLVAVTEKV